MFGKHVAKLRTDQGLSQAEYAEKCNLSTNYIGNIERGEYCPTIVVLHQLAKWLGISLKRLVDYEY